MLHAGGRVSRARFAALVEQLRRLDPQHIRRHVHATLPRLQDRETFDRVTVGVSHAALVDEAARTLVRQEILAGYRDRVSGERPIPLARIALVRKEARRA